MPAAQSHWLDRYGAEYHNWRSFALEDSKGIARPLGLVETIFDNDGRKFEGRADVHGLIRFHVQGSLPEHWQRLILLAWACLRAQHSVLRATAEKAPLGLYDHVDIRSHQRHLVLRNREEKSEYLTDCQASLVFLEDEYTHVDPAEFMLHAENSTRTFFPSQNLSRLFVFPTVTLAGGSQQVSFMFLVAHQITDGLTMYNWIPNFHTLLNMPVSELDTRVTSFCANQDLQEQARLPPAQEDLYPPISPSRARRNWSWLLTRIYRHIRRPLPPAFPNPLSRKHPIPAGHAPRLPPHFAEVLDYSANPPLLTHRANAALSRDASNRLQTLAHDAGVSLGGAAFALVALVMQSLHDELHPGAPRKATILSFPLNPRSFFASRQAADSLMLAFCDGIVLPFLPPDLPVAPRLRLLAKQAQRQLQKYQRRSMQAGGPGARAILQDLYVATTERTENVLAEEERMGFDVQGQYPARLNPTRSTCGVSWLGKVEGFVKGPVDGYHPRTCGKENFELHWMDVGMGVRVRDGEFLIGGSLFKDQIRFGVSYDGNAYDEKHIRLWERKMETILLEDSLTSKL
jgi:hypothetical protein